MCCLGIWLRELSGPFGTFHNLSEPYRRSGPAARKTVPDDSAAIPGLDPGTGLQPGTAALLSALSLGDTRTMTPIADI
ncbi:hypothetical protein CBM2606_A140133 [Cupriavidus taiwanensis]|nr:hypothetical protein CBM2606_A140133 [Cupriavidus taiwanensis]